MLRFPDLLDPLRRSLEAEADPARAAQMRAYLRDLAPFLGVAAPERRRLQRHVVEAATRATADELLEFAEACWRQPEREFQYVATDVLRKGVGTLRPTDLSRLERLIRTRSWWDTVDALAAWTVGPLVRAHPELRATMDHWIDDDDIWIARSAILHQLSYGADTDARRLFAYADRRADDSEFFIRKALGWALRQYARVAPEEVRAFVESRRDRLSRLTRQEALKRLG